LWCIGCFDDICKYSFVHSAFNSQPPFIVSTCNRLGLAGHGEDAVQFVEGPLLQIESEHPYKHNTNEYTTVQVKHTLFGAFVLVQFSSA